MKLLPFLPCVLLLSSCYHVYYSPNTPNVSLLTEKQELRVNGGVISGFDSDFGGGDFQIAYSPGKNFAVMVNGFSASKTEETYDGIVESGSGQYGEVGLGYFTALDPKKKWLFEVYGGIGSGAVKSDYGHNEESRVKINKLFIQPAIGFKSTYFEMAFAPRIAHVGWKTKSLKSADEEVMSAMDYIAKNPDFITLEPGFILRAGHRNVKAQLGLTFGGSEADDSWNYAPRETLVGYLGVSFNFSTRTKPVAKPNGL